MRFFLSIRFSSDVCVAFTMISSNVIIFGTGQSGEELEIATVTDKMDLTFHHTEYPPVSFN